MLKLAVADAFSMAATLLVYHRSTEGLTPDPEWQARLEQASDKFAELRDCFDFWDVISIPSDGFPTQIAPRR
ncbi:MAG: hypothetical protein BRD55_02155 [Bacteroidetes bacterium SW_9_63_38]|nr:MAG: hypothetical protein BRD55_02155 [Bacteroidetes bacterium SW_9_63_38]